MRVERGFTVWGEHHLVALSTQDSIETLSNRTLIIDNEDPHRPSVPPGARLRGGKQDPATGTPP